MGNEMRVERTATGAIIHQPTLEVKRKALQYFSLPDPQREYFIYSGTDINRKPLFGKEHDVLYITSGFLQIKDPVTEQLRLSMTKVSSRDGAPISITMNRQPRSRLQVDCIQKMIETTHNKMTVELKPGVGKEQPYSTLVPTWDKGFVKMGDLKLGDYVFGRNGMRTKITGIFEQGEKDVYKITFQDGRVAYCGLEHLWNVKTHKNGIWKTVMLKDMLKDFKRFDNYKAKQGKKDPYVYKYYIPVCEPVNYPLSVYPIDPWVLGCFIGNGCCREKTLTISSGNDWVPNEIAKRYGFKVKKNPANYDYQFFDPVSGSGIKTKEFFKDIPEMIDEYSRNKVIPDCYMCNSIETRLSLLQGLMDTDGHIGFDNGRYHVSYTSTSKVLLEQIQELLYSLGYSGTIAADNRPEKYTNRFCGTLRFRVPNGVKQLFFTLPQKKIIAMNAASQPQENHYDDLLIKNIEFSHREQCRCIMVDNPEHLYLTEDYIVTHNTFMALAVISKLGKKPLIIAPTTLLKNQWIENFTDLGIDTSDIATRIYDAPHKKVCVVTISAIENELRKDWEGLMNVLDEANFGIRITDEAHLHMKGVLKFDAIANIKRNYYLSATLGRSDDQEDDILNRALLDADRFVGNKTYEEYQDEYINVYLQDIYYNASREICDEHFKYGKKGLISATYYRMLMDYRHGLPFYHNAMHMVKIAEKIKVQGKVLLLLPLLDAIEAIKEEMKKDPYFNQYKIASVDGSMRLADRQAAFDQDIILATTMSCGTGVDIQNLGAVVNFDQKSSLIILEQIVGRLRNRGFQTYYIDVCDHVKYARAFENWGLKRRKYMPYFPGVSPKMSKLPKIMC